MRPIVSHISSGTKRRRRPRSLRVEPLETRALLSTFYVNGVGGDVQDGSLNAPFATIRQGVEAALENLGNDEVVILPTDSNAPYTTPVAIVPGYSELQIPGFSVFNGDLTIRGGGDSPADVVIDTGQGDGFYVDAPIGVTIANLTINQSARHGIVYRSQQQPLTVENVHITNHPNASGIIVQGTNLTVRDSRLFNNYQGIWGGIGIIAGTNLPTPAPGTVTVEDTVSEGNLANGAYLRDATGPVLFTGFTGTQNVGHGLWVTSSVSLAVIGGLFSHNALAGIQASSVNTVSISGATASDNFRNGIVSSLNQVVSVDGVLLERNGHRDFEYNPGGGGMHIRPGSATPTTISNSVVRDNHNSGNAGGIEIWGPQTTFMGSVVIANSVIEGNATRIDGTNGRGFGGGVAVIGNSNLAVTSSTIQGNASYSGGGVYVGITNGVDGVFPAISIDDSTVRNNSSTIEGGGVTLQSGTVAIRRSTIAGNSGAAGGLWMTTMGGDISNATISGNHGGSHGGAYLTSRNALSIVNSTVTDNFGASIGGVYSTGSSVQLLNTIIAQNGLNSGGGGPGSYQESDLGGTVRSLGHNILGEVDNVVIHSDRVTGVGPHSTDLYGTVAAPFQAMLGPLQDNGGPTLTHAVLPGSAAIDSGASTDAPASDQRSIVRPQDGDGNGSALVDIGAFELDVTRPIVTGIRVNDMSLADADEGSDRFVVTIDFSEAMNGAISPTLVFSPDVTGGATLVLSNASGVWSAGNTAYTVTYDVTDRNVTFAAVTIDVIGAQDIAKNAQQDYTPEVKFSVDMQNPAPTVSFLTSGDSTPGLAGTIDDASASIVVQIGSLSFPATNNGDGTWTLPDNVIHPPLTAGRHSVQVTATDSAGNMGQDSSTDELLLVLHTSTDIILSNDAVNENISTLAADLVFGQLASVDSDPVDQFVYTLTNGEGNTDNARFRIDGNTLFLRQGQVLDFETQPSYSIRVRTTDLVGHQFEKSIQLSVNNLVEIQTIQVGDGTAQRSRVESVSVTFDGLVTIDADAFVVTKRGTGGGVVGVSFTTREVNGRTVADITFSGGFVEFRSLKDGNYELRIDAGRIHNASGFGLDGDQDGATGDDYLFGETAADKFFRYFGDCDGDRDVDATDYGRLGLTYRKIVGQVGYNRNLDFDVDGDVDATDYGRFSLRYRKILAFQ